jgi:hypothetical protein
LINQSTDKVVVKCDRPLVIGGISQIYDEVFTALNSHRNVVVCVDGTADVDVTFLQLLVSADKTARALGREFSVSVSEKRAFFSKLKCAGNLLGEMTIGGDAS